MATAVWNTPAHLPALADNPTIHYEPGAKSYAREVAALLPAAIARIEAAQGRPFAHPPTIGVYLSQEAYVAANGTGSAAPVGVTFFGCVTLSPKLFTTQRNRLPAILTHELSHAHIQGWIGFTANLRLPNWFKEGLAVMVSGGGGAELVSEAQARAALRRGDRLAIDDAGSLQHLAEIRVETIQASASAPWYPVVLAYREAGMFVAFLRASDEPAFAQLLNAILEGRPFAEAVTAAYHADIHSLWSRFLRSSTQPD
jgi:hypothetical protein